MLAWLARAFCFARKSPSQQAYARPAPASCANRRSAASSFFCRDAVPMQMEKAPIPPMPLPWREPKKPSYSCEPRPTRAPPFPPAPISAHRPHVYRRCDPGARTANPSKAPQAPAVRQGLRDRTRGVPPARPKPVHAIPQVPQDPHSQSRSRHYNDPYLRGPGPLVRTKARRGENRETFRNYRGDGLVNTMPTKGSFNNTSGRTHLAVQYRSYHVDGRDRSR